MPLMTPSQNVSPVQLFVSRFRLGTPPERERGFGLDILAYPRDLRTHILRLLGPKTILYKAFGLF